MNGFHDTANAVATVIYTHSLTPNIAVMWSGAWNFIGVLISSGAVAFGILQLLPVELILQVGSSAGFAMVFALLIAAIIWNLATWYFGLPSSSSHTLIGSIIGGGLMNQWMRGPNGTSGVGLVAGGGRGQIAAVFARGRIHSGGAVAVAAQGAGARALALQVAEGQSSATVLDSRAADSDLHGCPSRTVRTTARRTWVSSC